MPFLIIAASAILGSAASASTGPCDIYAAGNTPCVAAYSTTRALYGTYAGNLYQVRRSDGKTQDIVPLVAGGTANSTLQDAFCTGTKCRISIIYDQSGKGNHLTKAPAGSKTYGLYADSEAVADALPVYLNGSKVYGVHITPGGWTTPGQVGYRNTATKGIAKGDDPETTYMIADGTYVNGACCFDFGNAEMDPLVYTSMDAIYFGTNNWWDVGSGSGPWIMADLENGVYNHGGATTNRVHLNSNAPSMKYPFVTALLKTNKAGASNGGPFTIKGGNAQSGALTTMWDGARPDGYKSLGKAGGIVLGIGGDNSSGAQGNFFEGVMTSGFASSTTDDAIQANIVAAGYGSKTSSVEGATGRPKFSFQPSFSISGASLRLGLPQAGHAQLRILDLRGRVVSVAVDRFLEAGVHEFAWSNHGLPSGMYTAQLLLDGRTAWSGNYLAGR